MKVTNVIAAKVSKLYSN